jgi:hypothetical protein
MFRAGPRRLDGATADGWRRDSSGLAELEPYGPAIAGEPSILPGELKPNDRHRQ